MQISGNHFSLCLIESKRIYLWFQHAPVLPLVGGEEEGVEDGAGVSEEDDQPGVRREAVQELAVAVEVTNTQSGPRNYMRDVTSGSKWSGWLAESRFLIYPLRLLHFLHPIITSGT